MNATLDLVPHYSVEQIAERLNISRWVVYRAITDKKLPHLRIGRAIRISAEHVRVWSERVKTEKAGDAVVADIVAAATR